MTKQQNTKLIIFVNLVSVIFLIVAYVLMNKIEKNTKILVKEAYTRGIDDANSTRNDSIIILNNVIDDIQKKDKTYLRGYKDGLEDCVNLKLEE